MLQNVASPRSEVSSSQPQPASKNDSGDPSPRLIALLSLALNWFVIPPANRQRLVFEEQYLKTRTEYNRNIHYQVEPDTYVYMESYNSWNSTAIRFTLGVVEAAVMPAMLIYISNWFTKSERSRANTFLILGNPVTVLWMSVVSGYLIQAFGWREMFIIEGIPAVIWAFCWWALVKDKPAQAKWLSEDEKAALQAQLDKEQQGDRKSVV